MSYTPTDEEQAFIRAYRRNVAVGSLSHILYFLANKNDAPEAVVDQIHTWSNIEDAWLMWRDAMDYAKGTK
jgi:hypothetical protein